MSRLFGFGALGCRSGCTGNIGDLRFYCTDISEDEDWVAGARTYTYNIGTTVTTFEAAYVQNFDLFCWRYVAISILNIKFNSHVDLTLHFPVSSIKPVAWVSSNSQWGKGGGVLCLKCSNTALAPIS